MYENRLTGLDFFIILSVNKHLNTGWPKKVSHYRESSLNRIKNRQPG